LYIFLKGEGYIYSLSELERLSRCNRRIRKITRYMIVDCEIYDHVCELLWRSLSRSHPMRGSRDRGSKKKNIIKK